MLIGLIGSERCGKDTMALYLCGKYGYDRTAFADPIKEITSILFGWDRKFYESDKKDNMHSIGIVPRDMLYWLGTEIFQKELYNKFPNIAVKDKCMWVNVIDKYFREGKKNINKCVISDVRFLHEAEYIVEKGGILVNVCRFVGCDYKYDINKILEKYDCKVINNLTDKKDFYKNIDLFINPYLVENTHMSVLPDSQ